MYFRNGIRWAELIYSRRIRARRVEEYEDEI